MMLAEKEDAKLGGRKDRYGVFSTVYDAELGPITEFDRIVAE